MDEIANSSNFAPPSAVSSAEQPFQTLVGGLETIGKTLEGLNGWQIFFSIVILSVTYDQCLSFFPSFLIPPRSGFEYIRFLTRVFFWFCLHRSLYLEQGVYCWAFFEDPFYGTFFGVC